MDPKALYKITYGLYLLTAQEACKDNGCIINTVMQVADRRIAISVLKRNLTHDMLQSTGKFNLSALSKETDFEFYRRFGMQSGRAVDKFAGFPHLVRAENGLLRLTEYSNMYLCAKVLQTVDLGSHSLFLAEVEDAQILSQAESCTYDYYQTHIKPHPVKKSTGKKWVCDVCGWVYDEATTGVPWEDLPDDFVCPLCKHGKEDFSPIN